MVEYFSASDGNRLSRKNPLSNYGRGQGACATGFWRGSALTSARGLVHLSAGFLDQCIPGPGYPDGTSRSTDRLPDPIEKARALTNSSAR